MKYLITYDLNKPGQYYNELFAAIENVGQAYHVLQNAWIVKSAIPATQIRDVLKVKVDSNDRVFVCEVSNWASFNMNQVGSWLNGNLIL